MSSSTERPGEIWLIRHGETEWTLSGAHTSRTDLTLTPEGEREAKEVAQLLQCRKFARVFSSPRKRAIDTCRLAGYTPQIVEDLAEWDYGDYEGRTSDQIQQSAPGWTIWTGSVPGGETGAQVAIRADRMIQLASSIAGDVAFFSHGHMLRVLGARWLGLGPDAGRYFALSTASVSVLGHEHETRVLWLWNQAGRSQ